MDTILTWLTTMNLFEVALTAFASAFISVILQKKEFEKGVQVSEQSKNEIIQEMRGQIASLKDKEK
jgi:hypothetical protein